MEPLWDQPSYVFQAFLGVLIFFLILLLLAIHLGEQQSKNVELNQPAELDHPKHPFAPGDWVYVKSWTTEDLLQPKWKGPHQVLLSTDTSAKVEGIESWIYHTDLKKAAAPKGDTADIGLDDSQWTTEPGDLLNELKFALKRKQYRGCAPNTAFSFGDTYGNTTMKSFQDFRSAAMETSCSPYSKRGQFLTLLSRDPSLVIGARARGWDRWLHTPDYSRFNLDMNCSEELQEFHKVFVVATSSKSQMT